MNSKDKGKSKLGLLGVAAAVILVVIVAGAVFMKRYAPSKQWMSGYEYFDADKASDSALVIINGTKYQDTGVSVDGIWYLPADFIADNINIRFYEDGESNAILYTDDKKTYTYEPGKNIYTDSDNNEYNTNYPVTVAVNGSTYIAWDYVAQYTNCTYAYGEEPARICINSIDGEEKVVDAKKDIYVRYRGGIKSDILEKIEKGSRLYYEDNLDDWIKVTTQTGYTGYVKSSEVNEDYIYVPEDTYVEEYTRVMSDGAVRLGWFQVGGTSGNSTAAAMVSSSSVNVISPTWYSIASTSGSASSYAQASWVSDMHARGIKVWPLINDFDKDIDYAALFSSKSARRTLIGTLIKDATAYGYDGINLDFENVKKDYAKDFLQFVRELAVECHKNNIILSTDNYKPENYNKFYNLKEQSSYVDYVIVMAYDEHYAGSEAGSVASLPFVMEAVSDTVALVPSNQVIVGIPFYTRIWSVSGSTTTSRAVGMQDAINELNADGQTAPWNEEAGQYVSSYEKNGVTKKTWFEEDKSVEEKLKVISEYDVAGIAAWKLGLEKSSVWSVISSYIR